jgi:hypothetical protein
MEDVMRRCSFVSVAGAVLLALAGASTAHAEELGGRFGLGADAALGLSADTILVRGRTDSEVLRQSFRVPGLSASFYLTDFLGLQLIAALSQDSGDLFVAPDGSVFTEETTVTTAGVAFRVLLALLREDEVHLSIAAGASVLWSEVGFANAPDYQQYRLGAEVSARPEWFVSESFSLHTQIGVSFAIYDLFPGMMPNNRGGIDLQVFGNANLLGNAGFTWWF